MIGDRVVNLRDGKGVIQPPFDSPKGSTRNPNFPISEDCGSGVPGGGHRFLGTPFRSSGVVLPDIVEDQVGLWIGSSKEKNSAIGGNGSRLDYFLWDLRPDCPLVG